jgi:hypothetical protein
MYVWTGCLASWKEVEEEDAAAQVVPASIRFIPPAFIALTCPVGLIFLWQFEGRPERNELA